MRRALSGAALAAALALVAYQGTRECGWIDMALGLSGCAGALTVADLASVRSTVAFNAKGEIFVAGNHYTATKNPRTLNVQSQIAVIDWQSQKEVRRLQPGFSGRPDQLQLSPSGGGMAIACLASYDCNLADLPPDQVSFGVTQLGLLDEDGSLIWSDAVRREEAQPSVEGRAFDLAFSADGRAVIAGPVAFSTADGTPVMDTRPQGVTAHATILASYDIELAGQKRSLSLPVGFVPFTRLQTAAPPDGKRLATLSRRFSGEGTIRSVLQIWDIAAGKVVTRRKIKTDLSPALAWHPDGSLVFVATASQPAVGASTQIRAYQTKFAP